MVFKICGYRLFRDCEQQSNQGKSVKDITEANPGDLIFFDNKEGRINHVGIALDGDRIIHASGRVRIDHLNEEGILNVETKIYSHQYARCRRILPE
jgi:cell wall-associated NlpC family hydrolase